MNLTPQEDKVNWLALPNELQADLVGILHKEIVARANEDNTFLTLEERDEFLLREMQRAFLRYTNTPEPVASTAVHVITDAEYDEQFRMQLLKDIPYFHALYAKYNDPQYLEIVRNLAKKLTSLKELTVK